MKTIVLLSTDSVLRARLGASLGKDEHLILATVESCREFAQAASSRCVVVLDSRQAKPSDALEILSRVRIVATPITTVLVLLDSSALHSVRSLGGIGTVTTEAAIADRDDVALVIRAFLNDPFGGISSAVAASVVLDYVPPAAAPIINATVSAGFAVSSVKEYAAALRVDSSTIARRLRSRKADGVGLVPADVVDAAKASFAGVLLRTTALSITRIAGLMHISTTRSLNRVLRRVFGVTARRVRIDLASMELEDYLRLRLSQWTKRRRAVSKRRRRAR